MRFFVSYCAADGNDYARRAKELLESLGHYAWVFELNARIGKQVWSEEIAPAIGASDVLLCILTPKCQNSDGMKKEIGIAQGYDPLFRIWPLFEEGSNVKSLLQAFPELRGIVYEVFANSTFEEILKHLITNEETVGTPPPAIDMMI